MKPEIKAKWVAELRSGRYKQGKHALHNANDEYCCLGVLCKIAVQEGVIAPAKLESRGTDYVGAYAYDGNNSLLPEGVVQWAGLENTSPTIYLNDWPGVYDTYHLASRNDGGATFDEIAGYIERGL